MAEYLPAGRADGLAEGQMMSALVNGREVLLARIAGRVCAADNRCPHLGGDLSRGTLQGTVVTCPRHGSRFDLSDGQVVRWLKGAGLLSLIGTALKAPRPLRTYRTRIEGDDILVEVD